MEGSALLFWVEVTWGDKHPSGQYSLDGVPTGMGEWQERVVWGWGLNQSAWQVGGGQQLRQSMEPIKHSHQDIATPSKMKVITRPR